MSDGERSALEVLQDLISGKLSLKDIWNALTGEDDKVTTKLTTKLKELVQDQIQMVSMNSTWMETVLN